MRCFYDGAELFPNYKHRANSWKCPACKRWFVGRETDWKWKETELARQTSVQKVGKAEKAEKTEQTEQNTKEKERKRDMWKEKVAGKVSFDEVGMVVTGRITDIKDQPMASGSVNSYTIVTDEGETLSFLGTTVLDRLIGHELDSMVKIEYLGSQKTGSGRTLKNFKVEVWEDDEVKPEPVAAGKKKK